MRRFAQPLNQPKTTKNRSTGRSAGRTTLRLVDGDPKPTEPKPPLSEKSAQHRKHKTEQPQRLSGDLSWEVRAPAMGQNNWLFSVFSAQITGHLSPSPCLRKEKLQLAKLAFVTRRNDYDYDNSWDWNGNSYEDTANYIGGINKSHLTVGHIRQAKSLLHKHKSKSHTTPWNDHSKSFQQNNSSKKTQHNYHTLHHVLQLQVIPSPADRLRSIYTCLPEGLRARPTTTTLWRIENMDLTSIHDTAPSHMDNNKHTS